jgi:hypothetical protein
VVERVGAGGWVRLVTVLAALAAGCNQRGLGKQTTADGGMEVDAPAGEHVGEKDAGPGEHSPTLDAGPDAGMPLDGAPEAGAPDAAPTSSVPGWVRSARIAGLSLTPAMTDAEVEALVVQRAAENVSVVELDSGLSYYLDDAGFDAQVAFLDRVAARVHAHGMNAVIYYPSLEVVTTNGETLAHSMYKDHPDWIQVSIDGTPNVFYGSKEHWVRPGEESAWLSPNSAYRDYFLGRVRKLAGTGLDGIWADVPIYLDTGTPWADASPPASAAFRAWTAARGLGGGAGLAPPAAVNFADPVFRSWLEWRHDNLGAFIEDIRSAVVAVKPSFVTVVESFPVDDMDGTAVGLDGAYRRDGRNLIRVWEVDSVSNTNAMQWSTIEDFSVKIGMFKWARAAEHGNPAWVFSYGNQAPDARLVLGAAAAAGVSPFECKTPDMTTTVDTSMRTSWFGFLRDHSAELLDQPRLAQVGVWFSSATRDYQDFPEGGEFGLYLNTRPPVSDPDWWASSAQDSALPKPHLAGWRGAAHALFQLAIPFRAVLDPGEPAAEIAGLPLVWLPDVGAISDASAAMLDAYVSGGGVLLATGRVPGTLDATGAARAGSALAGLFGFTPGTVPGPSTTAHGKGFAIYEPSVLGKDLFTASGNPTQTAASLAKVEALVRAHVASPVEVGAGPGVLVEVSQPSATRHNLFVLNYSGLQLPLVSAPRDLVVRYRPPAGQRIKGATLYTPDAAGQVGTAAVVDEGAGLFRITLHVDQFTLVALDIGP